MTLMCINLFSMSVYGGILILTILFVRAFLKDKLPRQAFLALWCVALVRLILPLSVSSSFSAYSLIQRQMAVLQEHRVDGGGKFGDVLPAAFGTADFYGEETGFGEAGGYSATDNGNFDGGKDSAGIGNGGRTAGSGFFRSLRELSLFQKVSIGITAVFVMVFLFLYLNCLRIFGTALPLESRLVEQWMGRNPLRRKVRVRQSDRISSPLTYGIFRPVILLPKQLEQEDGRRLEYILQHELVHIRRFDGAWKLVMTAALCLHWFNPLVWMMYMLFNRDVELACDEGVLRIFGAEARKSYAMTLICMEERKYAPLSLYSGFGKNAVEERVNAIMKYRKKTKAAAGAAAVIVLVTAFFFATSAQAGEKGNAFGGEVPIAEAEGSLSDTTLMDPPAGYRGDANIQNTGAGMGTDADAGIEAVTDKVSAGAAAAGTASEGPVLFPGMSYAAGEEDNFSLLYTLEGMEESEPAWLEYGQGYCVLIPKEDWKMSAPDEWVSEKNEDMVFRVVHFSEEGSEYRGMGRDQIAEAFMEQGYQRQYGDYQLYKEEEDITFVVEIRSNGADIWGLAYAYPSQAQEGFGIRMRAMARHFGIISMKLEEDSEYALEKAAVTEMVQKFVTMSQPGQGQDAGAVSPYLSDSESLARDMEILEAITECDFGEMTFSLSPTKDAAAASVPVRTRESDESVDYLTIGLVKEEGEWKIDSLGLEK